MKARFEILELWKKYSLYYYKINRKQILKKKKLYHKNHKQIKEKYYIKNRNKIINQNKEYFYYKLKTDLRYRIKHNLRVRIHEALKFNIKSLNTEILIGCSIEFLKRYLEKKFKSGMTWKNYGKWHIDHIKPCCRFDLSKKSEQMKCFNYKNFQPLWAKENLQKARK